MAHSQRARLSGALLLLLALAAIVPAEAVAQEPAQVPLEVRLIRQPVWHEPDDKLNIHLRITNEGAEEIPGFDVRIGVYDRVRSRSELQDSLDISPGNELYVETHGFDDAALAPGDSTTVVIDEPVESFDNLRVAEDGGVFPITLAVYDKRTASPVDFVTSQLIYYPEDPVEPFLGIVPILPLAPQPSQGPDGAFILEEVEEEEVVPLQAAAADGGWLRSLVEELREAVTPEEPEPEPEPKQNRKGDRRGRGRRPKPPKPPEPIRPLHIAIAPDPRFAEELASLASGYRTDSPQEFGEESPEAEAAAQTLDTLKDVLRQESVDTLATPYGMPDLPRLTRLESAEVLEHLSEGTQVAENFLPGELDGAWFFPPGGHLDAETLAELLLAGDEAHKIAAVSSASLVPPANTDAAGCPEVTLTFTCPITIPTRSGTAKGFVSDAGVAGRLEPLGTPGLSDRLTLQQFFAETSMIREEIPGTAGRVIQATFPSDWAPSAYLSHTLVTGLWRAPWLRSLTPQEAMAASQDPEGKELLTAAAAVGEPDLTDFYAAEAEASAVIDSYGEVAKEEVDRLQRLTHNLLVAQSLAPTEPEIATTYATASRDEAISELEKIRMVGVEDVTLTSSKGRFQLVLTNGTDSPVDVRIALDQPQLEVDPEELDELSTTYPPGNHPLTINARARASGSFEVGIRIESPDGYIISQKDIRIRSTAFNRIALGITVGALLFLVLFYMYRVFRRSRNKGESEADPA